VPFAQHIERAVDVAQRARHLGLAHPGRAGEDHVPADRGYREPLLAAHALHFERRHELVDLLLDRVRPDHLIQHIERLIERALRWGRLWNDQPSERPADRLALRRRRGPRCHGALQVAHVSLCEIGGFCCIGGDPICKTLA